jgi:hypothetical protein
LQSDHRHPKSSINPCHFPAQKARRLLSLSGPLSSFFLQFLIDRYYAKSCMLETNHELTSFFFSTPTLSFFDGMAATMLESSLSSLSSVIHSVLPSLSYFGFELFNSDLVPLFKFEESLFPKNSPDGNKPWRDVSCLFASSKIMLALLTLARFMLRCSAPKTT